MSDRSALADAFLKRAGWGNATRHVLAGDASHRRYDRLTAPQDGATAVLMDAPPEKGEDVRPFIRIAGHLAKLGLSPPRIIAEDAENGFLLLEDLGDDLFARVIPARPEIEETLYAAATDLLAQLHRHPLPDGLATYSPPLMADLAALAIDWYLPGANASRPDAPVRNAFQAETETVLSRVAAEAPVLILRDYHAENLLWLPGRSGVARVGLLDFQDAMAGHPAYDLVSLLQDARRDVPDTLREAMIARYLAATGRDEARFRQAFAALGAQRNLRILGVFTRLCLRDGKPHYIDLLPRVWADLERNLAHPALSGVKRMVAEHLPAPTADIRQRIKDRCNTTPMA